MKLNTPMNACSANELQKLDVRVSNDAGHYLCDFIYYSSLAHLWKREEERRVLFLHVPVESDEVNVKRGSEALLELVRSAVVSLEMGRWEKGKVWVG
jgi:pyroglutamyl-peptidase